MDYIKFIKENYPIIIGIIYFLFPADFIPDFILGVGQLDDIGILVFTLALNYFKAKQREKVENKDNYSGSNNSSRSSTNTKKSAKDAEYEEGV